MSLNSQDRPQTGEKALQWAVSFLREQGFALEDARQEARLLLAKAWQKEGLQLLLEAKSNLPEDTWTQYTFFIRERGSFTPLHYLLGEKEFMSLSFRVSPEVLIPRWDTEVLVEEALRLLQKRQKPKILDLGTGSGVIALSLAHYLPQTEVVAVDISPQALELARENAQSLGVEERVRFVEGDLFTPLAQETGQFHLIASNPPYLSAEEMADLPPDVQQEPALALAGGEDGLDYYRAIALEAKDFLAPGGHLLVEIGYRQGKAVTEIFRESGLAPVRILSDLEGRERVVVY